MRTLIALIVLLPTCLPAQNLPEDINLSPDGRQLITGNNVSTGFYREDTVRTIALTFAQSNYWTLLTNNYSSQTPIWATMVYNGNTYDSVGVRFKGSTSYFSLPPGTQKMSFDIDMNHFVSGQDVDGYTTVNLNNSFQDNSFMREVVYEHFVRKHIPAAKANFVNLTINGQNWGMYLNVQGLNGSFIDQWFYTNNGDRWRADVPPGSPGGGGWGDGTAAMNWHGTDTADYQGYYTLQDRNTTECWEHLVKACDELNNTPAATLEDSLNRVMDVDRVLWHMASEIAFSDDDSYVYKGKMDYSLYYEPESGRMTTLEYDGNTVLNGMNVNWDAFYHATDVDYPLLEQLLAVPALRQRYLAHLRTIITEELSQAEFESVVNTYQAMVDPHVQADPIKLMTYAQFTSGVNTLKSNRTTRVNTLNANTEVQQVAPTISNTEHESMAGVNQPPVDMEGITVRATVASGNGIFGVTLYYCDKLWGAFKKTPMYDNGLNDDGAAGDGVYGGYLPGHADGTWVRYYIEAAANNTAHSVKYDPVGAEHNVYVYQVAINTAALTGITINELMASNSSTAADEAGQFEDWIELHNSTSLPVDIGGWFMSDTEFEPYKWQFPVGTVIGAYDYLIAWCDEDGSDGPYHTNFKLSAGGESALLLTDDSLLVDQVDFTAQVTDQGYARIPNGYGPFVIQTPTFSANNSPTAVTEAERPTMRLFPNPARDAVALVLEDATSTAVTITDLTGRAVWQAQVNGRARIDVGSWAAGTYVVRAGAAVEPFVVVR